MGLVHKLALSVSGSDVNASRLVAYGHLRNNVTPVATRPAWARILSVSKPDKYQELW